MKTLELECEYELLDKIRTYGNRISRYDLSENIDNVTVYNESDTIFIYEYLDDDNINWRCMIHMISGEYIEYCMTEI